MGIGFGLATALFFGAADFLAQWVTRRLGSFRTQLYSQAVGLLVLSAVLGATHGWPSHRPAAAWAWGLGAAALNAGATLAFYRALEIGALSLVSPVTASFGAVAAVLSLLGGERLLPVTWLGIALSAAGVAAASVPAPDRAAGAAGARGLGLAAWAALGYGATFWLLGTRVTPALGPLAPVWLFRLVGLLLLLPFARARPARYPGPLSAAALGGVALVSLLDTAGLVALMFGLRTGQIAVVSVLSSLFSAVTVLLALVFLRERLSRYQWAGIAVILLGVALVNA